MNSELKSFLSVILAAYISVLTAGYFFINYKYPLNHFVIVENIERIAADLSINLKDANERGFDNREVADRVLEYLEAKNSQYSQNGFILVTSLFAIFCLVYIHRHSKGKEAPSFVQVSTDPESSLQKTDDTHTENHPELPAELPVEIERENSHPSTLSSKSIYNIFFLVLAAVSAFLLIMLSTTFNIFDSSISISLFARTLGGMLLIWPVLWTVTSFVIKDSKPLSLAWHFLAVIATSLESVLFTLLLATSSMGYAIADPTFLNGQTNILYWVLAMVIFSGLNAFLLASTIQSKRGMKAT